MIDKLSFGDCKRNVQPREERTNDICCATIKVTSVKEMNLQF